MKNIWNILCSHAIVDSTSNNISLINIVEQITIRSQPMPEGIFPYRLDLASFWTRDDPEIPEEKKTSKISLISPSGMKLGEWTLEVNLSEHRNSRNRLTFNSLPMGEEGIYLFRVEYRNSDKGRWIKGGDVKLIINFAPPETLEEEE